MFYKLCYFNDFYIFFFCLVGVLFILIECLLYINFVMFIRVVKSNMKFENRYINFILNRLVIVFINVMESINIVCIRVDFVVIILGSILLL